ncbi:hypothetical protein CLV52_1336 [Amnibacterium kyonggiense]|uniref:Parallel beta helix pectate lyase-like protein n=1 Tax=Amnibacterium kyonggiense TaxID=595671 RepID=A0A4R7FSD1_9MICO|nr:hypothetical protein CLV52_1336 [Amnibacterium kyonggiense]
MVAAATAAFAVGVLGSPGAAASAAPVHRTHTRVIVVSPHGSDRGAGTSRSPLRTLQAAQGWARTAAKHGDAVTVQLRGGTYRLAKPLDFGPGDSGRKGAPITWTAAPGQHPVISGGTAVRGWRPADAGSGVWVASVPKGRDSRQLYKDGAAVPRASIQIQRSAISVTDTGFTITDPALAARLDGLPDQRRIEVESQDSFTDRYAPVASISGTTVTMQQPAWRMNNWGYDTLAKPFAGGTLLLENSRSFLQEGQWYLDPQHGKLYYRAKAGERPADSSFVLPQLQSLVRISGTLARPVHDLAFSGIAFSYSTWLSPSTSIGYADQQNGAFIPKAYPQPADYLTSCQSGCKEFEGARNGWHQMPAAVQVAAATRVRFSDDAFTHLGQVGLGIGNDVNANGRGTGLAASSVTVHHNLFTDLGGAGVVVGGISPDAHHPRDRRMTVRDVTLDNNLVTDVAKDYKEMSGILSTYVTHAVIAHNEVSNLAYDGIDVGWGWGANDPGGSNDYRTRGLYAYQPVYTTPTTLKDTVVEDNLIHGTKKVFHDGGSLYNLSANPGAVYSGNYIYDNLHTVGLYLDEGSRYVTMRKNVVQDSGVFIFTNSYADNDTLDDVIEQNWYNDGVVQTPNADTHRITVRDNTKVTGTDWPAAARKVIAASGIEPRYGHLPGQTDPR